MKQRPRGREGQRLWRESQLIGPRAWEAEQIGARLGLTGLVPLERRGLEPERPRPSLPQDMGCRRGSENPQEGFRQDSNGI